jgi:hypothetical protein
MKWLRNRKRPSVLLDMLLNIFTPWVGEIWTTVGETCLDVKFCLWLWKYIIVRSFIIYHIYHALWRGKTRKRKMKNCSENCKFFSYYNVYYTCHLQVLISTCVLSRARWTLNCFDSCVNFSRTRTRIYVVSKLIIKVGMSTNYVRKLYL